MTQTRNLVCYTNIVRVVLAVVLVVLTTALQMGCATRKGVPLGPSVLGATSRPLTSAKSATDPFKKLRDALEAAQGGRQQPSREVREQDAGAGGISGDALEPRPVGTMGAPPTDETGSPTSPSGTTGTPDALTSPSPADVSDPSSPARAGVSALAVTTIAALLFLALLLAIRHLRTRGTADAE